MYGFCENVLITSITIQVLILPSGYHTLIDIVISKNKTSSNHWLNDIQAIIISKKTPEELL